MPPTAPARPPTCGWRRRWPRVAEERRGMGRGLDAILPRGGKVEEGLRNIPPDMIQPNGRQPRRVFDDARLAELAESIRVRGVLQPIVVRPLAGGSFELVAGGGRPRGAEMGAGAPGRAGRAGTPAPAVRAPRPGGGAGRRRGRPGGGPRPRGQGPREGRAV